MKQYRCIGIGLLMVVFLAACICACSDDNDPTPVPTPSRPEVVDPVQELPNTLLSELSPAFGKTISKESTPNVYEVIMKGLDVCINDDGVLTQEEKAEAGWLTALLLVEIKPQTQNEILTKGYQLGIVSQDFGNRIDGNAAFRNSTVKSAIMHTDNAFLSLIEEARKD